VASLLNERFVSSKWTAKSGPTWIALYMDVRPGDDRIGGWLAHERLADA